MKKVITGDELYNKMEDAINLLCGVVKMTLGPKGRNSIINTSLRTPFITNDGVTIAKEIVSEDIVINSILDIAKESSIKTDNLVGDGTTTTLVLLESIFKNGLKLVRDGVNPIILKENLNKSLEKTLKYLKDISIIPKKEDYRKVACVSSNDDEIGNIISEVYSKIKNKNGIKIIESSDNKTEVVYFNGYLFDTEVASNYYFHNASKIILNECLLLIIDDVIDDLELISEIINEVICKGKNLIIFAKDYSDDFVNNCLVMYLENGINIVLLKNPMYGDRQIVINEDLACLSGAKINNSNKEIKYNYVGYIKGIEINKEKTIIKYDNNELVMKRILEIQDSLKRITDEFEYDYFNERLAMFENGLANIKVGGLTKIECMEKKMRYDDALCAISNSDKGVVFGGGVSLLKISRFLEDDNADGILKKALMMPFMQILENAGVDSKNVLKEIESKNYNVLYNVKTDAFENINNTNILDPLSVVSESLSNAVSISSMLLTTSSLIINEVALEKESEL